jgi:FtsH-binding integral membrane protein
MNDFDSPQIFDGAALQDQAAVSRFVANVFSWMSAGLLLTGVVAYYFAVTGAWMMLVSATGGMSILGWVVMLAPFAFILAMNAGLERWSAGALVGLFLAFASVMGMSLSFIFIVYASSTIFQVFGITALTFLVMAIVGYTTKQDLTSFGRLMFMGLVGIVIASLVNWFMQSAALDYVISIIGVLVFVGLIAYDTQKVKRIGAGVEYGTAAATKLAILGATTLYLDFVNLFLFLLRLFGGRRD